MRGWGREEMCQQYEEGVRREGMCQQCAMERVQ